jgi:hypothetical protein
MFLGHGVSQSADFRMFGVKCSSAPRQRHAPVIKTNILPYPNVKYFLFLFGLIYYYKNNLLNIPFSGIAQFPNPLKVEESENKI